MGKSISSSAQQINPFSNPIKGRTENFYRKTRKLHSLLNYQWTMKMSVCWWNFSWTIYGNTRVSDPLQDISMRYSRTFHRLFQFSVICGWLLRLANADSAPSKYFIRPTHQHTRTFLCLHSTHFSRSNISQDCTVRVFPLMHHVLQLLDHTITHFLDFIPQISTFSRGLEEHNRMLWMKTHTTTMIVGLHFSSLWEYKTPSPLF